MTIPVLMPALSPTMEEGTLAKWLVKEGDAISSGDVIAEIETDKATMEVEAVDEGTVGRILVDAGTEGVAVNKPIMVLLEEGEDASALDGATSAPAAGPAVSDGATPQIVHAAKENNTHADNETAGHTRHAGQGSTPAVNGAAVNGAAHDESGDRIFASPLARRIAGQAGIDLSALTGSGPRGRIVKADVEAAQANGIERSASGAEVSAPAPGRAVAMPAPMADDKIMALYEEGTYDVVPHDNMRKTIATRLVEAKSTIPHFYLSIECRLDSLLEARKRMNDGAGGRFKLSVNDFIIKALGLALQAVPGANATWTEKGMLRHTRADVGVAVAVEGGLFTPVIRHADLKTLSEISNEMKDLAGRARDRKLKPHEYQGGTTAISNLGMMGIKRFDAVINPPHATILAIGAGEERMIVVDGAPVVANMMSCTLSCDHRVVDGALGAELLAAFKNYIEDPVRMLV
ncbi:MAG: pyruvate dehydrogenase complex dihydrolipoamide acetyltransferase [Pseudomonadota bacterium]